MEPDFTQNIPALTREQAAIVGAYTGIAIGPFSDVQAYADHVLGRPTWTHEFGSKDFMDTLRAKAFDDFVSIGASE